MRDVFCSMPILYVSACIVHNEVAMSKMRLFPVYLQIVQTLPWIWIYRTQPPAASASPGSLEMTTGAQSHVSIHLLSLYLYSPASSCPLMSHCKNMSCVSYICVEQVQLSFISWSPHIAVMSHLL